MAFGGENAESYYDEGLTAAVRGDLTRAIEYFEKSIRLDSSMATAYHQLGKCYSRLGQQKKAIKLLSQVVQKRPQLAAARLDLGHALNGLGELEAARKQFDSVLATDPTNAKALMGIAESESIAGRWESALAFAQSAQQSGGNNYSVLMMIGRAAKHMGQAELSVRNLQRADKLIEKHLEANPQKPEGHFLRGEIASVLENDAGAMQHYQEAERYAEPGRAYLAYGEGFTLADILARRAQCLHRLGRKELARDLAGRIAQLNPEHPALATLREE